MKILNSNGTMFVQMTPEELLAIFDNIGNQSTAQMIEDGVSDSDVKLLCRMYMNNIDEVRKVTHEDT